MVRPNNFQFNEETAGSNAFQERVELEDVATVVSDEFNASVKILEEHRINVKVFESVAENLPDSIFPNNWIAQIPDGPLTIFPMQAKNRQAEINDQLIDWAMENTNSTQKLDLTDNLKEDKFLEGTGSIVFDHTFKKAFACVSLRTDVGLLDSYCKSIGYTPVSFDSVDLSGIPIYHTNVMMSIASKYVIVNLDSIENQLEKAFFKLELEKLNKTIIPISHSQTNNFAGNVIEVLNEKGVSHLVMSERAYASFSKEQLEKIEEHSTIVKVPIPVIQQIGGGGIRCMIAGFFR